MTAVVGAVACCCSLAVWTVVARDAPSWRWSALSFTGWPLALVWGLSGIDVD